MNMYEEKSIELLNLHSQLQFQNGSLADEFPEQVMTMMFLQGNEKVLELGGNIGRNSIIIGHILNKNNNHDFVTLETNTEDANILIQNRDINSLKFHVENSALSNRKLIQSGWNTIPSSSVLPGYFEVKTITWKDLYDKYKIIFDTLVIDCEGAFYYILQDMPEILDNIKLIMMENDYFADWSQKDFVLNTLINVGFKCVFNKELSNTPYHDFYQVWKR
jgi:FkbM family methyltransferase